MKSKPSVDLSHIDRTPISDHELLTPRELAERLRISERSVYREQREGKIPGRLARGKLRFYWPDVVQALPIAPVTQARHGAGLGPRPIDMLTVLKDRAKVWGK